MAPWVRLSKTPTIVQISFENAKNIVLISRMLRNSPESKIEAFSTGICNVEGNLCSHSRIRCRGAQNHQVYIKKQPYKPSFLIVQSLILYKDQSYCLLTLSWLLPSWAFGLTIALLPEFNDIISIFQISCVDTRISLIHKKSLRQWVFFLQSIKNNGVWVYSLIKSTQIPMILCMIFEFAGFLMPNDVIGSKDDKNVVEPAGKSIPSLVQKVLSTFITQF